MQDKLHKVLLGPEGLFESSKGSLAGKQRVDLLKAIEALTRKEYSENAAFQSQHILLGSSPESKKSLLKAVLDQQWQGIPEYSQEFYKVLDAASSKQQLTRAFVRQALQQLPHGFDALDTCLLHHASLVNDAYDIWYRAFAQAIQGNETAKQLEKDDKAGKVPKELFNNYTVISYSNGEYSQVAYATYFKEEIAQIVSLFDAWIVDLQKLSTDKEDIRDLYIDYLSQYRECLAETEIDKLDGKWCILDEKWMKIRYPVQVVHDIEYGYGDPLRTKVTPEFSIRLMDESYAEDNKTISKIQDVMVDYFRQRDGPMAKDGISALKKSLAAIYYLPFQCGVNLYFRFSGQSIPNRSEVRHKEGVKIYFDPVSTAAREESARDLAARVLADPSKKDCINTVGTIVWHVAAHEIGHAIYGLDGVKGAIKVSTKTLLEEPRAELTALHTMTLLLPAGLLTKEDVAHHVASFMLQDLRRFQMFDSSATRPYTVSAMACWKRAADLGYLTLDSNKKVVIDDSKVMDFLTKSSNIFEMILDAEDAADGPTIEHVLGEMEGAESSEIVQHLLSELFPKHKH